MKLGTRKELFSAYGDGCYLKMKECGFDYADVSISGELDGMSEAEYEQRWLAEKALADAAGVVIHQTHGPWRFPPHDETEALRAERAEVMKRSIRITAKLGGRYTDVQKASAVTTNVNTHAAYPSYNSDLGMIRSTGAISLNPNSIDRILLANGESVSIKVFGVVADECTRSASDHFPMFVDFSFAGKEISGSEWSGRY